MPPSAPFIPNDLGLNYGRKGKTRDAADFLRKTIELDPDYAEAYDKLGSALLQIGDRSSAEEAFRNCIWLQPSFAGAQGILPIRSPPKDNLNRPSTSIARLVFHESGYASAGAERYDQARTQFEAAIRLDPNLPTLTSAWPTCLSCGG